MNDNEFIDHIEAITGDRLRLTLPDFDRLNALAGLSIARRPPPGWEGRVILTVKNSQWMVERARRRLREPPISHDEFFALIADSWTNGENGVCDANGRPVGRVAFRENVALQGHRIRAQQALITQAPALLALLMSAMRRSMRNEPITWDDWTEAALIVEAIDHRLLPLNPGE